MADFDNIVKPLLMINPGNPDGWNRVYATVAAANAAIPNNYVDIEEDGVMVSRSLRYGKVVQIGTVTDHKEYRWIGGFEDGNLKEHSVAPSVVNELNLALWNPSESYAQIGSKEVAQAWVDANDNVYFAIFIDGTTTADTQILEGVTNGLTLDKNGNVYTLNFGEEEGIIPLPGTDVQEGIFYHNGKEVLWAVVDNDLTGLLVFYKDGTNNLESSGGSGTDPILTAEVTTARGQRLSLNDRLTGVINNIAMPTTPVWGGEVLRKFNSWKVLQNYVFDWLLFGDSYTQGNFFTQRLRQLLLNSGLPDGGPGWCGFAWGGGNFALRNSSIDLSQLDFTLTTSQFTSVYGNGYGADGCHIVSTAANAVITITSTVVLDSLRIVYERHSGAGDFRYRVNGGSWITVPTANSTQDISSVLVNTSTAGTSFTVDIEVLAVGVILCGAIGRKGTNALCMHKLGITGGQASGYSNALHAQSVALLTPKAMAVMFATNEMNANTAPSAMKSNIQTLITKVRAIDPVCDLLTMCPTQTKYETEEPKTYKLNQYGSVLFELAQSNTGAFINHSLVFGPFSQALVDSRFMATDRVHPHPELSSGFVGYGGTLIANTIFSILK